MASTSKATVRITRSKNKEIQAQGEVRAGLVEPRGSPFGKNLQTGPAPRSEYFKSIFGDSSESSMGKKKGEKKRGNLDPEDAPIAKQMRMPRGGDRKKRKGNDPWKGPIGTDEGASQGNDSVSVQKGGGSNTDGRPGLQGSEVPTGPTGQIESQTVKRTEMPGRSVPTDPAESVAEKPAGKEPDPPPEETAVFQPESALSVAEVPKPKSPAGAGGEPKDVGMGAETKGILGGDNGEKTDGGKDVKAGETEKAPEGDGEASKRAAEQAAPNQTGVGAVEETLKQAGIDGAGRAAAEPPGGGDEKAEAAKRAADNTAPSTQGGIGSQEFFGPKITEERMALIKKIAQDVKDGKGGAEADQLTTEEVSTT